MDADLASFMPLKANVSATLRLQFNADAVEIAASAGSAILDVALSFSTSADAQAASTTLMAASNQEMTTYLGGFEVSYVPEDSFHIVHNTLVSVPSPPPPPLPPLLPYAKSVCLDTCQDLAYNGVCDDVGAEHDGLREEAECVTGTDCYDCGGARSVCEAGEETCSDLCRQLGYTRASQGLSFCASDMLSNGVCDPECNNYQCEHDYWDCDEDVAKDVCSGLHLATPTYWRQQPGNYSAATQTTLGTKDLSLLPAMELRVIKFQSFHVSDDDGVWKIDAPEIKLSMRWRDSRLATAPCRLMLAPMFTLTQGSSRDNKDARSVMQEDKKIIWFPQLTLEGEDIAGFLATGPVKESAFAFDAGIDGGAWSDSSGLPDGSTICYDCATFNVTTKLKFDAYRGRMPNKKQFEFYPFDRQYFRMKFRVASSSISSCSFSTFLAPLGSDPMAVAKAMLPKTEEWTPIPPYIDVQHVKIASGADDPTTCELKLYVQRNYQIFLVKQVTMSIIIVYLGLIAMYMGAADHTGDRAALIGVSALIVMFNFQTQLVIGTVTYLVWWDIFNLVAFMILFLSLVVSIYEHILIGTGEEERSLILNKVSRRAILLGVFPSSLVYLFISGLAQTWSDPRAIAIFTVCLLITIVLTVLAFKRLMAKGKGGRLDVVTRLRALGDFSDPQFGSCLQEAFSAFDLDNSGLLDIVEARDLFHVLYFDQIGALRFPDAMLTVRQFADGDGQLTFTALLDAIIKVGQQFDVSYPTAAVKTMLSGFEERWAPQPHAEAPADRVNNLIRRVVTSAKVRPTE